MKKITYVLLAVLLMVGVVRVNAISEDELYNVLTKKYDIGGTKWGVREELKTYIRRYLDEFEVSEAHADYIKGKVDEALVILKDEGTGNWDKLSTGAKDDLKALVEDVSNNTSVKATIANGGIVIKNPKTGGDFYTSEADDIVKYTGTTNSTVAIVAGISLLILAAGSVLVVKQVKEN